MNIIQLMTNFFLIILTSFHFAAIKTNERSNQSKMSHKLCYDVKLIINILMPGKFSFHRSHDLEKICEMITGRATNQLNDARMYAKLCSEICQILPEAIEFKKALMGPVNDKFHQLLFGAMSMKLRLGTARFIGELYNFNIVKNVKHLMDCMAEATSVELQRELYELINITGCLVVNKSLTTEPVAKPKLPLSAASSRRAGTQPQCPICLDDIIGNQDVVSTICGHIFCEFCLENYLEQQYDEQNCPVCKKQIRSRRDYHRIFI